MNTIIPPKKGSVIKPEIFIKHHEYGLRILEAWPAGDNLPGFYISIGVTLTFLVFQIWNITEVYDDFELLIDNLISTIGAMSASCKMIMFRIKRRRVKALICKIFDDWKFEYKQCMKATMIENCTRSKLISKLLVMLYNAIHFTYILRAIASYIFDAVEERRYLYPVTFPFNGKPSPIYELIVLGQFVATIVCFNNQALIDGLFVTSVTFLSLLFYGDVKVTILHTCTKANMVREEITRFSKDCQSSRNDKRSTKESLSKLMQEHMKFIKFSESIEDVFSFVAFYHTCLMTLLQVVAGYMFLDGIERGIKPINLLHYAMLTSCIIISSGFYCAIGEYLTYQSEVIFRELCDSSWYNFPKVQKKSIKFMLVKAAKPVYISVGKFSNLSLMYFTQIMKASFSYLSLVRAFR